MLHFPTDIESYSKNRPLSAEGFQALHRKLAEHHFQLVVVLVPDKYTVYYPLMGPSAVPPRKPTNLYLSQLQKALENAQVPSLDLTPVFRRAAELGLRDGKYIYSLDDTHWNADGIRLPAQRITQFLKQKGLYKNLS